MPVSTRAAARHAAFVTALLAVYFAIPPRADALDPRPRTYRERARHDFRDVQLGLCHPADGTGSSRSVKCSEAAKAPPAEPAEAPPAKNTAR